jgi:hypothetical protein
MRKIICTLILFSIFIDSYSQINYAYNPNTGVITRGSTNLDIQKRNDHYVKYGDPMIFRVEEVNPFIYKTAVTDSLVSIQHKVPSEILKTLFVGFEGFSDLEILKELSKDSISENGVLEKVNPLYCECERALNETFQLLLAASQNVSYTEAQLKTKADELIVHIVPSTTAISTVVSSNSNLVELIFQYLESHGCCIDCERTNVSTNDVEKYEVFIAKVQQIVKLYQSIKSCSFTVQSSIIYAEADEHIFTIQVKPVDTLEYTMGNLNRNRTIRFWTKNKFNINLSGGIGLSGLQNTHYSLIQGEAADSSKQKITEQSKEKFRYGAAINAHLYYRMGYKVNPALSLGILYDSDKKVSPIGGLSLIFGNKSRLILTGGVALGKQSVLQKGYEAELYYSTIGDEAPMREVTRVTWFTGLTFNTSVSELFSGRK